MIHVIERNEQFGIQIFRTSDLAKAREFVIEGGFPEANEAAQDMAAAFFDNLMADVYVVIDSRGDKYDFEVMSV